MFQRTFVVLSVVVGACFSISSLSAQPVQNILPLEQTNEGITLRISRAGFPQQNELQEDLRAFTSWGSAESRRPTFFVRYQILSADQDEEKDKGKLAAELNDHAARNARIAASTVRLLSPSGELLKPCAGASEANGQQLQWNGVNPYWEHVTLEVQALDPKAPLKAAGWFAETLTFTDVPLPPQGNKPFEIGDILRTANGTEVILDSVTLEEKPGTYPYALRFDFLWEPLPKLPELSLESRLEKVLDEQGQQIKTDSWGSGFQGRKFHLRVNLRQKPTTKNVSVVVHASEKADALRQEQQYRRFRFQLKLPAKVQPDATLFQKPQVLETPGLSAILEKPPWRGEPHRLQTWLWLKGKDDVPPVETLTGARRAWFIKEAMARNEQDQKIEVYAVDSLQSSDSYPAWRSDGLPVAPSEHGQLLQVQWQNTPPRRLSLEAFAEEKWHHHAVATFEQVPIPAPGQGHELNMVVNMVGQSAENGVASKIALRRIVSVSNPKTRPNLEDWQRAFLREGSLALLFEVIPLEFIPALPKPKVTMRGNFVDDNTGRRMHPGHWIHVAPGDLMPLTPNASRTGKNPQFTVLLYPPLAGAKSLRVQVVVDQTQNTGRSATLRFEDVSIPKP